METRRKDEGGLKMGSGVWGAGLAEAAAVHAGDRGERVAVAGGDDDVRARLGRRTLRRSVEASRASQSLNEEPGLVVVLGIGVSRIRPGRLLGSVICLTRGACSLWGSGFTRRKLGLPDARRAHSPLRAAGHAPVSYGLHTRVSPWHTRFSPTMRSTVAHPTLRRRCVGAGEDGHRAGSH